MSTYLVAFTISDFAYLNSTLSKEDRVYSRPQYLQEGRSRYALHLSNKTVTVLEEFLSVKYPMGNKIYQVAIPEESFPPEIETLGLIYSK